MKKALNANYIHHHQTASTRYVSEYRAPPFFSIYALSMHASIYSRRKRQTTSAVRVGPWTTLHDSPGPVISIHPSFVTYQCTFQFINIIYYVLNFGYSLIKYT